MAALDILVIGNVIFEGGFGTPNEMPFGGKQMLQVHKLPGGSRVIDTLGPDDLDFVFKGTLFQDDAIDILLDMDAMRVAGLEVPLIWGGMFWNVVISEFKGTVRRYPMWADWELTCVVSFNPLSDAISGLSSIDGMVSGDLDSAGAIGS